MFGTHAKLSRPTLLILVFGAFIALVGITAAAQAYMVGAHFQAATLNDVVSSDAATTRAFVNAYVQPADLATAPAIPDPGAAPTKLEGQLATLTRPHEILRVELRRPDGTIVAANDPAIRGTSVPVEGDFALAVGGAPQGGDPFRGISGSRPRRSRLADPPARVPADQRRWQGARCRRDLARCGAGHRSPGARSS